MPATDLRRKMPMPLNQQRIIDQQTFLFPSPLWGREKKSSTGNLARRRGLLAFQPEAWECQAGKPDLQQCTRRSIRREFSHVSGC